MSKYDNRSLWEKYDIVEYNIIGEPYFDVDFLEVLYLTDTGRRWDGEKMSVRDKVKVFEKGRKREREMKFHSTYDIIKAANHGLLPDKLMITVHPQRWTDKPLPWMQELVLQNIKNAVKRFLFVR